MNDYVMVPVPAHLVPEVMLLITKDARSARTTTATEEAPTSELSIDLPSIPWTEHDLEKLQATPTSTAKTVSAILTELTKVAPKPLSTSQLEAATGIDRRNIKGSLSALTRHVKKHYGRSNWPMTFQWGPELDPTLPAEAYYNVGVGTADVWANLTKHGEHPHR